MSDSQHKTYAKTDDQSATCSVKHHNYVLHSKDVDRLYTGLSIDYPVQNCKISVIIFGYMLPNL